MNYENIQLEKGMYATKKGFAATLEELDPSEQYEGTALAGLDAYQRQLKRFDIRVSGAASDPVEKFFSTTSSAALFPEYVSRAVRQGMQENTGLSQVLAATTHINSMDYRSLTSQPTEDEMELKEVAEGALIPTTNVNVKNNLVKLKKRGRMLVASYEAIRFQRLDLFTVALRQIGAYISQMQFKDAVDVLEMGDGNSNYAEIRSVEDSNAGLTRHDLLNLWGMLDPYELNTIILSNEAMKHIMASWENTPMEPELKFWQTGVVDSCLGAKVLCNSALSDGKILGLDRRYALEMVVADDVRVDYDKLIDRQLERASITTIAGFAKIFPDAVKAIVA